MLLAICSRCWLAIWGLVWRALPVRVWLLAPGRAVAAVRIRGRGVGWLGPIFALPLFPGRLLASLGRCARNWRILPRLVLRLVVVTWWL